MKKITLFIFLLTFTSIIQAQTPEKMSYQAIIRNNAGELISKQDIGVKISVLQGSASSDAIYEETYTRQTNENGLLSLEIGGGTVVSGDFASIDWSLGPYFLQVETDPTGGTTYSIAGVSQLLSVPFALFAKSAGNLSGGSEHYVGELYGGGIVFYTYDNGRHGLIASLEDLNNGTETWWGSVGTVVETNAWDGATNTTNIMAAGASSTTKAVGLCDNYASSDGSSDWYLPSIWELNSLLNSAAIISKILDEDGDETTNPLQIDRYWSSTSLGSAVAHGLDMSDGIFVSIQRDGGSDTQMFVRAVRSF